MVGPRKRKNFKKKYGNNTRKTVDSKQDHQLMKLDKRIAKIERDEELKYNDRYFNQINIGSSGSTILLNGVNQGDEPFNRIGSDIRATSIQFRMKISSNNVETESEQVRCLIYWDSQPNTGATGAFAGAAEVLDTSVIADPVYAPYNRQNQKRFKVLYDKILTLNPQVLRTWTDETTHFAVQTIIPVSRILKKKIPLSRVVKYNTTGIPGVYSINTNALVLQWYRSLNDSAAPFYTGGTRFYFKDD